MRNVIMGITVAAALVFAQPAAADTVSDWWEFANKLAPPGGSGTPDQMRSTSRVSLAMFEALNAIDRRYESYLNLPAGDPTASQDAAAVTAAYLVLVQHYPAQKAALDDSYAIAMQAVPDAAKREAGRLIGEQAAAAAMAAGGIDPAIVQTPYRPVTRPGQWIATSLPQIEPFMSAFKPWVIPSAEALRPPPPPALNSERWARDYDEVRRLGGRTSTERTPTQTLAARYRQAFDLTPSMRLAADAPGRTPVQNARMFAVYQMAFDDAVMAMSAAKAHYDFWRPITAIRNGADDGNDATAPDVGWVPLLGTPNFAEYPCGHCTVAGALGEVMENEVGPRPATGVRVASQAIPNSAVQVLPSWDEWVQEVSDSRIYGGVHYRFSNEAGEEIGRRAARMVLDQVMRPLPRR
ncbi:hypothetical protein GCM10007859_17110 [Brevundimonas denitrificans]|uniref:PAP2 superfamily protein n=1 Tax=Brevundimonas denitrificans TaxID=1443434 RepID=A0ABQ6BK89_9CAUL|nr:vanadium-dependent haloperoxidase [Brevundimonas denitrificans]GLS01696.1 hypothetical protein GCM10007859_17110 [Brevundimonas denitrificans]